MENRPKRTPLILVYLAFALVEGLVSFLVINAQSFPVSALLWFIVVVVLNTYLFTQKFILPESVLLAVLLVVGAFTSAWNLLLALYIVLSLGLFFVLRSLFLKLYKAYRGEK